MDDPWAGFCFYLEQTCQLQATDRGLNDAMGMRFPRTPSLEAARRRLFDLGNQLIDRAQETGQLRGDLTYEDLALVTWANSRVLQAVRAAGAPNGWRRDSNQTASPVRRAWAAGSSASADSDRNPATTASS